MAVIAAGALTVTNPASGFTQSVYVADLQFSVPPGGSFDVGAKYSQSQIYRSTSLKTLIDQGLLTASNTGTTPSPDL